MVQKPKGWPQAHRLKAAHVQGRLRSATLHRAGRWLLRVARAKQPYAIAMKDGSPFGLAGLWENWRNPNRGDWERTFAIITVPSNELVGQIHDRMPAILEPASYDRWLGVEPNPHDLLITYPSEPMTMWPISTRVNKSENDDPSLVDRTGSVDQWSTTHACSCRTHRGSILLIARSSNPYTLPPFSLASSPCQGCAASPGGAKAGMN
jgi:hypothetical protein